MYTSLATRKNLWRSRCSTEQYNSKWVMLRLSCSVFSFQSQNLDKCFDHYNTLPAVNTVYIVHEVMNLSKSLSILTFKSVSG